MNIEQVKQELKNNNIKIKSCITASPTRAKEFIMNNNNKIWSKNKKLNTVLTAIAEDLQEMGFDEVKRYVNEFPKESDHNIASYGNMLIYHDQIKEFYRNAGYIQALTN